MFESGDTSPFLTKLWILSYAIFNPIVFLLLLGMLFIYIVYRVIKHFKSFYHISLRFKLPRALVDGCLGLLLILLLYDFYGQIMPTEYGRDTRSVIISAILNNLIMESENLDGKDAIFKITAREWNRPECIRFKNANIYEYCNYVNGTATKDYYIFNGKKHDCPLYENSPLKECVYISSKFNENLDMISRLINHINFFITGEEAIYNEIPLGAVIEILNYPQVFQPMLKILSNPCQYINKSGLSEYSIEEQKQYLGCNKKNKDIVKLYFYDKDIIGKVNIKSQLIIKRED